MTAAPSTQLTKHNLIAAAIVVIFAFVREIETRTMFVIRIFHCIFTYSLLMQNSANYLDNPHNTVAEVQLTGISPVPRPFIHVNYCVPRMTTMTSFRVVSAFSGGGGYFT